jgi:hypothetical protein
MDLFANSSTTLVLGVGTLGAEVAAAGAADDDGSDGFRFACWGAAHTDAARLIATGLERKLLLDSGPAASGPFAERNLQRSIAAKEDDLRALTAGRDVVILTGSLQEQTAALLIPALAVEFTQRGLYVCAVTLESSSDDTKRQPIHADLRVPVIDDGASGEIAVGAGRRRVQRKLLASIQEMAQLLAENPEAQTVSKSFDPTIGASLSEVI